MKFSVRTSHREDVVSEVINVDDPSRSLHIGDIENWQLDSTYPPYFS